MLKQSLEVAQREIVRLNAQIRMHRGDKEIKLAEMATLVKSLSGKGDIHAQLSSARQDLESEKLTVHHLRSELDSYRYVFIAKPYTSLYAETLYINSQLFKNQLIS